MHDDTILDTIMTNHVLDEEGRCHPQQKDRAPFPRPLCCRWTAPALLVTVGTRLGKSISDRYNADWYKGATLK